MSERVAENAHCTICQYPTFIHVGMGIDKILAIPIPFSILLIDSDSLPILLSILIGQGKKWKEYKRVY